MRKGLSVGRATLLFALVLLFVAPLLASGQTAGMGRLQNEDPNNWPMYHRTYDSFRFSPLAQINKDTVKNLTVAWVHQPGAIVQGLESTPLVVDGVMFYIASYNRVFALDAATGKELWHFYPKLDPVVNTLFFQPYNRGLGFGHGRVLFHDRPRQLRVDGVTRLQRDDMTANADADERKVADNVENLVPREFFAEAQRLLAQHRFSAHDDGIFQASAPARGVGQEGSVRAGQGGGRGCAEAPSSSVPAVRVLDQGAARHALGGHGLAPSGSGDLAP